MMKKQLSRVMSIILAGVLLISGIMVAPSDSYAAGIPVPGTWVDVGLPGFSDGVSPDTSLYVDNGTPYVAFQDGAHGNSVSVMSYNGNYWAYVGNAGFSGGQAKDISLFVESGIPYVSYIDVSNNNVVTVLKYVSNSWVMVGNNNGFSGNGASSTSLYVVSGSPSTPYVAYEDGVNGGRATVVKFDGVSWVQVGDVGFSAEEIGYPSLHVDGGTPYVAYADYNSGTYGRATVMKYDGSNWVNVGSAGFSEGAAIYTSLFVDNGTPYVAYRDDNNSGKATVMKYDGSNWVNVGNAGFSGESMSYTDVNYESLYIDNGTPYVAFRDKYDTGFKATVMKYDGTNWVPMGDVGFSASEASFTSLFVSNGILYVAYQDSENGDQATVKKFIPSGPSLTADTMNNDVANDIEITFTDDQTWRGLITGVYDEVTQLVAGTNYSVSAGTIIIDSGVLSAGNHMIKVKATGYSDTEVSQPITGNTPPSLTADTTNNDTANAIDITFTDNPVWRAAITSLKEGSTTLAGSNYTISAGKLTIKAGVLAAGSHSITVAATGYTDAMVSQTINTPYSPPSGNDPVIPPVVTPVVTPVETKPTPTPTSPSDGEGINFSDIFGHWAEANIKQAANSGIVKGYFDGTFKPGKTVTRAEFAVMLMNTLKPEAAGAELTFKDTAKIGAWAKKAVAQAVQADIIKGYTDGSFRPDAEITRAEMAAMIANALGQSIESNAVTGFSDDQDIPAWAKGSVAAMKKLGIVEGKGANTFDPNGKTTRAEAVTVLLKMLAQKSK